MDLNAASPRDLQQLAGVGYVTARLIIESRPFATLEDLMRVKGIGPSKFALIKAQNQVYVDENNATKGSLNLTKVDLNIASNLQLQQLTGGGPGGDTIPSQLLAIKSIGLKSYVKPQSRVYVGLVDCSHQEGNDTMKKTCHETSYNQEQDFYFCREIENNVRGSVFPMRSNDDGNRALIVASWNIRNISRKKETFLLQRIADVLGEFGLVALQEVWDSIVLKRLKTMLPGWDYVASDPVVRKSPERYAFFQALHGTTCW